MNIFDFITQDEIDDLPDDDPNLAFVSFVRIAQQRLGERAAKLNLEEQSEWEELNEARLGFMNVVVAAAKKHEIEPFASISIPRVKNFRTEDHVQFKSDLDHYLTQLMLDNSSRAKRDSVLITPDLKTTLRTYIFHLRELIEKSSDLDEAKRQVLLRRLSDFERELEKKRLSILAVSLLAITLASAPGGIWSSADVAGKLVTNILRTVGDAKAADEGSRHLPPSGAPMSLTGPRLKEQPTETGFGPAKSSDMNDDIPF